MNNNESIQLLYKENNDKIRLNEEALTCLKSIEHPFAVWVCVGPYLEGKSIMFDSIAKQRYLFKTDHVSNEYSKGIFMLKNPIKVENERNQQLNMLMLDIKDLEPEFEKCDPKIFLVAVLLSTTFIYNIIGKNNSLNLMVKATKLLSLPLNIKEHAFDSNLGFLDKEDAYSDKDDHTRNGLIFVEYIRQIVDKLNKNELIDIHELIDSTFETVLEEALHNVKKKYVLSIKDFVSNNNFPIENSKLNAIESLIYEELSEYLKKFIRINSNQTRKYLESFNEFRKKNYLNYYDLNKKEQEKKNNQIALKAWNSIMKPKCESSIEYDSFQEFNQELNKFKTVVKERLIECNDFGIFWKKFSQEQIDLDFIELNLKFHLSRLGINNNNNNNNNNNRKTRGYNTFDDQLNFKRDDESLIVTSNTGTLTKLKLDGTPNLTIKENACYKNPMRMIEWIMENNESILPKWIKKTDCSVLKSWIKTSKELEIVAEKYNVPIINEWFKEYLKRNEN